MLTIERPALEQLATLLLERAGLKIPADGFHGLKLALKERMPALGMDDAREYVRRLRDRGGEHELRLLLPLVTVTHTEFFRDARQFRALETKLMPEALARARAHSRKVALWSAGCATGEEPYSLAMLLADLGATASEVNLWATDLNHAAVENAKLGRYPLRRVGAIAPERVRRYFHPTTEGYEVQPHLKGYVRFEGLNLAAPVFSKVDEGTFDIILCRNVIIYFDLPTIRGLMDRFYSALRPGGFLLLGYSESLFRVYDRFEMVEVDGSFLYRRPRRASSHPRSTPAIDRLAHRIGELSAASPTPTPLPRREGQTPPRGSRRLAGGSLGPGPASAPALRPPAERLAEAAKKVDQGAFEESISLLIRLCDDEPGDLSARLTLGNVYSLMGRADDAARVFLDTNAREPLCVELRVYGGMAAMQAGDFERARSELGKALFLEPTLALAHYLAARSAERLGDRESARRSYRNAIAQLRFPQRPLAGYYPELPEGPELISRAARYALAALEELD